MATITYAGPKRTFVRPSRNYDHLYDPNFYVSSSRDHAKQSFKAQTSLDRIRYVPNYKTMFSSLRHYPSKRVTLDMTDPVPPHVSRQWKGYHDQAREAIIRYKKFTYDPQVQVPPKHFEPAHVRGKNRSLFFRRPIIPFLPQMPPNVVLAPTRLDPLEPPQPSSAEGEGRRHLFDGPNTRSVLIQTDYRESEAQTDPYSPEYVVRPGSQPELLTLASLSYGRGLPAGLAEVEMIERARAKRAWEASLPPLADEEQMEKRRKMMEEQERKEWAFREHEIENLQEERLDVVKQMLQQREVDHHALNSKRMEHYWSKKQAEKERYMRRLHSKHVQALRRLTAKSSNVEKKLKRKSVIHQYSNFDSQVYAPMTRIGVYMDSNSEQYNTKSKFTTTLDGLIELEETLPLHVLHTSVKSPVRSASRAVGMQARRQLKLASILAEVHSEILHTKTKGEEEEHSLRLLKRVEKPVPRPPTPSIPIPEANQEERELALVLIQRVVRGRAIQTKMFEGKERRQQLIQELRTTHALQSPEHKLQRKEAESVRAKQADQESKNHEENIVQDGSEQPVASHLGQRLDFLTKELVRLEEERRVAAYVMLAERERRIREAEESGRRQREERIRRTEDEMFKQMMRVHQGTVDTYLQDVILKSVDRTADEEARKEIAEKAKSINKLAHDFKYTELSAKELVAEMVHSFLLPEVEKRAVRQKVQDDQRKHLLAAHRIILEIIGNISPNTDGAANPGFSPPPPNDGPATGELGSAPSSLSEAKDAEASASPNHGASLSETKEEVTDKQGSLPEVRIQTATTKLSEAEATTAKQEPLSEAKEEGKATSKDATDKQVPLSEAKDELSEAPPPITEAKEVIETPLSEAKDETPTSQLGATDKHDSSLPLSEAKDETATGELSEAKDEFLATNKEVPPLSEGATDKDVPSLSEGATDKDVATDKEVPSLSEGKDETATSQGFTPPPPSEKKDTSDKIEAEKPPQ